LQMAALTTAWAVPVTAWQGAAPARALASSTPASAVTRVSNTSPAVAGTWSTSDVLAPTAAALTLAVCAQRRRKQLRRQHKPDSSRATSLHARGGENGSEVHTGYNTAVGGRLRIRTILEAPDGGRSLIGSKIAVCGWVRTIRAQKGLAFIKVNDGSSFGEIQAVVTAECPGFEAVCAQGTGASVRIEGLVVESPGKGEEVEISCTLADHKVEVLGTVDSKVYPLAKKSHTVEYLRSIAHLRPRSNLIGAVARVRNALAMSTHRFFQDRGFLHVHTPIITTADCEGAGEMFRISRTDGQAAAGDASGDFFGKPAYLTVSGQLAAESYCSSLGDVYTFGPTFRAENSSTTRHLAEFWMIEPEMAFANLNDDMDCAEAYIRFCATTILETCKSDLAFFAKRVDAAVQDRLQLIASKPFVRLSYTEAVEVLQKCIQNKEAKFEYNVTWGKELQTEHEKWLTDMVYKGPVIVYNYPKDCKAFYMRSNDDGKTVAAMDILCPGIGELVGGSQREERLEMLDARLEALAMPKEDLWWYRELRQYGSVPHAGFGVGFERLVMLCTGVQNIRDVIPFPRYPGHAEF